MFLNAGSQTLVQSTLVDHLLLHFYSSEPPVQTRAVLGDRGQGTCSPFSHILHSLIISTIRACNSLASTKKDLAQNHLERSPRKPLGGASSPSLLSVRLLGVISLQKCGVATALQDCTASLPQLGLCLLSSRNGKKLRVLWAGKELGFQAFGL